MTPMLRYKLRTLMIALAVLAVGLSWFSSQMRIVAQRRAVITRLENRGEVILYLETPRVGRQLVKGDKLKGVSWLRRWLGDEDEPAILFLDADTERQAAIDAFPEADIYILD